jgi:hypothetical protein
MYRQQSLAMAGRTICGLRTGGASVSAFVRNIVTWRVLLVIFWLGAFLLPWLLLVSACILKVCEALAGKEPQFAKRNKAIA